MLRPFQQHDERIRNYANEMPEAELDALADAGKFYLEKSGFFCTPPAQEEMKAKAEEGELDFRAKLFRRMIMEGIMNTYLFL
jgi:hypothetical protein